jgi:hypothetical protein
MGVARTIDQANAEACGELWTADPVLVDILSAGDAVPGYTPTTILTSGPRQRWDEYEGGQRAAIIGGALFEGLAKDEDEAAALIARGDIQVAPCHEYDCVGSLAGIYTASMPVLIVDNANGKKNRAFCNFYEGTNPRRLNYGVYDEGVRERLLHVQNTVAPVVRDAVRISGGIRLKPIMQRALHMGDELHSRNTAASLLFTRDLIPSLLQLAEKERERVDQAVNALTADHYFFLRLSMAAAKAMADAAHGVEGSTVVTAMSFNCRQFAIRVSGLGDEWFTGPLPVVEATLFAGHTPGEITWMGGESTIIETIGLGGFAQAAAFPLQAYQGGSPEVMIANNKKMYDIVVGEHPDFKIPFFGYRGAPSGIDLRKVLETGTAPIMNIGVAGRNGGQIGAGVVRAHLGCFESALSAYRHRYKTIRPELTELRPAADGPLG